jgi:hypothetical protein
MSHLEERKTAARGGNGNNHDFMLSQDSIKHFALEAEKETIEEREKLQTIDRQKREFAKKLRETTAGAHEQEMQRGIRKEDRLKNLLKQSEVFTHFILGKKGANAMQQSDIDLIKAGKAPINTMGGKSSVSKRH